MAPSFKTIPFKWDQRQVINFGGLPVPVTGQTLQTIDLNDQVSWFAQDIIIDNSHVSNKASQRTWRGAGVWTAADFVGRKVSVPAVYDEGGGTSFAAAKALLTQSGEQFLSFDQIYGLRVRCNSFSVSKFLTFHPPYLISVQLEFLSRNPFAELMGTATTSSFAVSGNAAGQATTCPISYQGDAYCAPIYTLNVPSSNGAAIKGFVLANQTSNETLTIANGVINLPAGSASTLVIDATQQTVMQNGTQPVKFSGAFPNLYPGFGGSLTNNIVATVTTTSGTTSNVTLSVQWSERWEI